MKNKEKFAEQIVEVAINGNCFAVAKNSGEVIECHYCQECIFQDSLNGDCNAARQEWAESEFESMWKKVPVDTPILVSHNKETWEARHFAEVDDNGTVYAFADGKTSWTVSDNYLIPWEYAKLPSEEEKEES